MDIDVMAALFPFRAAINALLLAREFPPYSSGSMSSAVLITICVGLRVKNIAELDTTEPI